MTETDLAPRILIVDDEEGIRKSVKMALSREGYEVFQAKDGAEAQELLSGQKHFDVVLSDIKMPRIDGLELLKWISNNEIITSVIMLSVNTELQTAIETVRLGSFHYLTKPVDKKELISAIEKGVVNTRSLRNLIEEEKRRKEREEELKETVKNQIAVIRNLIKEVDSQSTETDLRNLLAKINDDIEELTNKTEALLQKLRESEGVIEKKLRELENYVVGQIHTLRAQIRRELRR